MRILVVIASLAESGGAEMLARNLARDYVAAGHECFIAYISDAASLGIDPGYEQRVIAELDQAGVRHGMIGHRARRNYVLGGWRLRRIARTFGAELLHVHLGYGLMFQACGLLRLPTIYTHHNIVFRFPAWLFRVFDRFVDRYVAICGACEALLAARVGKPITTIHNGVPDRFARTPMRAAPRRDAQVLSVGNLTPQKDYPTLIAAAALLVPRFAAAGRSIRFDIAGEGGERPVLAAMIEEHRLGNVVRLLGARGDIAERMAAADLLVQTSKFEGLPLALIEGAMSALPIVATHVGGSTDVVANDESGFLVPPGRPERLAAAIERVLGDDARYAAFSRAAQARGAAFSLDACVEDHLALYHDVLARRRR